jgi:hypothetical protein
MKPLTQTIIPIVVLSLLATGVVSANNGSNEGIQAAAAVQVKKAELEQQTTSIVPLLAQAQSGQPAAPVLATPPSPVTTPTPPILPGAPTLPGVSKNIYNLTNAISYGSRTGSSDMVLVIPTEQTKTEDLIAINEDMNVMARILETNLEQDRIATSRSGIFVDSRDPFGILLGGSRGQIQSMYLQGYGALFMLKVDFPLSPSSEAKEEEKATEKTEEGDPVWRETQQQMFEPERFDRRRRINRPEVKYDPEKVENLKTTLIKTLKHATNIRLLKPDESVIVTVAGSGEATGTKIITANVAGNSRQVVIQEKGANGQTSMKILNGNSLDDIGLSTPTVLVIRAKKSEIDAFAKGELDFDKFRASVQMFSYPYLGSVELRGDNLGLSINMETNSTGSASIP